MVFLASTINGYEGTGRSLSLKLLEELRQQAGNVVKTNRQVEKIGNGLQTRKLYELNMEESIRYNPDDYVLFFIINSRNNF